MGGCHWVGAGGWGRGRGGERGQYPQTRMGRIGWLPLVEKGWAMLVAMTLIRPCARAGGGPGWPKVDYVSHFPHRGDSEASPRPGVQKNYRFDYGGYGTSIYFEKRVYPTPECSEKIGCTTPDPPSGSHGAGAAQSRTAAWRLLHRTSGLGRRGECWNLPSESPGPNGPNGSSTHNDGASSELLRGWSSMSAGVIYAGAEKRLLAYLVPDHPACGGVAGLCAVCLAFLHGWRNCSYSR